MTQKSGLDAHIVQKYAQTSTLCEARKNDCDPEKIWSVLGAMAMMNLATQHIKRVTVTA